MDHYKLSGYVEIDILNAAGEVVRPDSENGCNLILNNFRRVLPLLIAPEIITGRGNQEQGDDTWRPRRVALLGIGAGSATTPSPSVKPEDPEDGAQYLVAGDTTYPNAKQGLQSPMRRVPTVPGTPSEINTPTAPIPSFYLLKEVDPDGILIDQIPGGGAEIVFTFTVEEDEYIGNIMEYTLLLGGGDSDDDDLTPTTMIVGTPPVTYVFSERDRLNRELAVPVARKTRAAPLQKTRDFKFRLRWRIRT